MHVRACMHSDALQMRLPCIDLIMSVTGSNEGKLDLSATLQSCLEAQQAGSFALQENVKVLAAFIRASHHPADNFASVLGHLTETGKPFACPSVYTIILHSIASHKPCIVTWG